MRNTPFTRRRAENREKRDFFALHVRLAALQAQVMIVGGVWNHETELRIRNLTIECDRQIAELYNESAKAA